MRAAISSSSVVERAMMRRRWNVLLQLHGLFMRSLRCFSVRSSFWARRYSGYRFAGSGGWGRRPMPVSLSTVHSSLSRAAARRSTFVRSFQVRCLSGLPPSPHRVCGLRIRFMNGCGNVVNGGSSLSLG